MRAECNGIEDEGLRIEDSAGFILNPQSSILNPVRVCSRPRDVRTPFLERTLSGLGIDRAVGWTVAARVWSILAGPVSVILIAAHLSAEEQGFYYTFASIVAFQVIFELGLGMVIVQFASHEKAFLEWRSDGTLGGSDVEKGRLAALLRKSLQWYAVATMLTAAWR